MVVKIEGKSADYHVRFKQFIITVDPESSIIIKTTLTSDPYDVDKWITTNLPLRDDPDNNRIIVGFGVQWNLPEDALEAAPAATIQLCINRRCLIFHAFYAPYFPTSLHDVLCNTKFTFVGLYTSYDAFKIQLLIDQKPCLQKPLNSDIIRPGMPIDLRHHVFDNRRRPLKCCSVKQIVRHVLGFDLTYEDEGSVVFSDWEVKSLSPEQVGFATVDAFVSYNIGVALQAWKLQNPNIPRPII